MAEVLATNPLPAHIRVSDARQPATYERAKVALARCSQIDDCQEEGTVQELVPFGETAAPMTDVEFEAWREAKAVRIELVQATAVLEIAAHLAEVRQQHLFRRDEGGFTGRIERRLRMSQRTAYNLLEVHKRFGGESLQNLSRSVLYVLAPESTPEAVRAEVIERAEAGEHFTRVQVKELIDKAVAEVRENGAADQAAVAAQAAKDEAARYEKKLAAATEKYDAEVARLRTDLAGALSPDELQSAIDEALAPLQDKIKRLEGERDKRKREAPTRKDEFGLRAQTITGALRVLAASLTITPPQMIEAAKFVSDVTSRPVSVVLADDVVNARNVLAWLNQFIGAADERQKSPRDHQGHDLRRAEPCVSHVSDARYQPDRRLHRQGDC
jgi:hypothetical protein